MSTEAPPSPSRSTGRRVLIVSPSFPPMSTPDMQRTRMSLPHYRHFGWEPIVLTVESERQDGLRDNELLATIPTEVKVYRCGAMPLCVSRLVGIGNLGLRAWWHLLFAGARIIQHEKIDLVFFTNTQFVTFPLGRIWRRWRGVPYVIDLQDPWRTDYYERPGGREPPGGWKYQIARAQARLLEPWSFRKLNGFISVSSRYIEDLNARYPWFRGIPADTIPFGASEEDLATARLNSKHGHDTTAKDSVIRLVYTGAAGPITPHAAEILFKALRLFLDRQPQAADGLRLEFLGTSYAPAGRAQPTILPLAVKHGVAHLVHERPERLGHFEALRAQTTADALMLLGSTDPAYSPSKLYPYFMAGRPMLALVLQGSVLESRLQELSCARLVCFEETKSDSVCCEQLCEFFAQACAGFPSGTLPIRQEALFRERYLAPALTARQCALFDRAAAAR